MTVSSAPETIQVGSILADTYQVTRLIGKGGMGAVWEAAHLRLQNKRVAIKVLLTEVARDEESVIRFRREANIASQLGHANIVQVFDIKELADGTQYIVLEYLEGEALDERMKRGAMDVDSAMAVVRQVGSALMAAHHHGIVHRDLKPGNIMLVPTEFGGYATEQAKVLDFGISKMQDSSTLKTQTATVLGTPQYMAPEQALGEHQKVDARTDIFALGCIVYEMLAGQMAFQGSAIPEVMFKIVYQEPPPLLELAPHVPEDIARAVHRAMAKQQDERFVDMSAFIEALTGDPLTTLRSGGPSPRLPGKPPPISTSSRNARAHNDEAFAATVPPGSAAALSLAATAAPGEATPVSEAGVQAGSTVDETRAPGGRKSPLWHILIVLLVVGAAVGVTVVVMGGSKGGDDAAGLVGDAGGDAGLGPTPDTGAIAAPGTQVAALTQDAGLDAQTADAANQDVDASATSSTSDTPRNDPGPSKDPDDGDEPSGKLDPEALAKLQQAQQLFKSGDYSGAIRAAKGSVGVQASNRAWSIITRSYCAKKDLGNAKASARKIKGRERKRVARYCRNQGILL